MSLTVFTQRNFVADFLQAKCEFTRKTAVLRYWSPFGGLRATYDDHLRLIGKRVVDFLLLLIKLFFVSWTFLLGANRWGATSEYRLKIGDFAPTKADWPNISSRRGRSTNHSFSRQTGLNDFSYGIKIWTDLSSVLSQCTHSTDGRTDEQTDTFLIASPRWHCMQRRKMVVQNLEPLDPYFHVALWQYWDLSANISRTKRTIDKEKTLLKPIIGSLHCLIIWRTLAHKRLRSVGSFSAILAFFGIAGVFTRRSLNESQPNFVKYAAVNHIWINTSKIWGVPFVS